MVCRTHAEHLIYVFTVLDGAFAIYSVEVSKTPLLGVCNILFLMPFLIISLDLSADFDTTGLEIQLNK